MRKKFAVTSVLMSAALLLGTTSAFAATTSTGNSQATIKFTTIKPPIIVDPENPDPADPYDPIGDGGNEPTGNTGALTLDYAPDFNFGSHESRVTNSAVYEALDKKPFLQVTDRRAIRSKWDVKVKLGAFENSETPKPSDPLEKPLDGAKLTIKSGTVKSVLGLTGFTAPTTQTVVLTAGAADGATILSSAAGTFSTWLIYWPGEASNPYISLDVPVSTQVKGTYTATLDWVLSDVVN